MRAIHPVFHVSMLEPSIPNSISNRIQPPPPPITIDDELEYEISEILDSKWITEDMFASSCTLSNGLVMKVPMKKPPGYQLMNLDMRPRLSPNFIQDI